MLFLVWIKRIPDQKKKPTDRPTEDRLTEDEENGSRRFGDVRRPPRKDIHGCDVCLDLHRVDFVELLFHAPVRALLRRVEHHGVFDAPVHGEFAALPCAEMGDE